MTREERNHLIAAVAAAVVVFTVIAVFITIAVAVTIRFVGWLL